jgi:hypothetical protein
VRWPGPGGWTRQWLVERGTMPGQRIARLAEVEAADCPYFAIVLVPGHGPRPEVAGMTGWIAVAGLGPGDDGGW